MNNAVLPLLFLLFYLIKAIHYNVFRELLTGYEQAILIVGFLGGLVLLIAFSFAFFFGADRTILRTILFACGQGACHVEKNVSCRVLGQMAG